MKTIKIGDSFIHEETIKKVMKSIKEESRPISAGKLSNYYEINYNSLLIILEYLLKENKIERIDTSAGVLYQLKEKEDG